MSELRPRIITGLPPNVKEPGQRVDFKPEKFDLAIRTKGIRLWWSRTSVCPCRTNEQTDQPDPTCDLCLGFGRFHFLPEQGLSTGATDVYGNAIEVNTDKTAAQIVGLVTGLTKQPQLFERFGEWAFGMARLTTQPENQIGYRDRFEAVDAIMPWGQLVEADGTSTIGISKGRSPRGFRMRPISIHLLRTVDTVFAEGNDWQLNDNGTVTWLTTPPTEGTLLTAHYLFHPAWQVVEHLHVVRDTLVRFKQQTTDLASQVKRLPVQSLMKLEFMLES